MAYPKFGIYQAIVTDNSEFFQRGYLRVRVSVFYNETIEWDLSQGYNKDAFTKELANDIKCFVGMPIGGGSGHGMFSLPQVNSVGMVSFLDGNTDRAVWMGSFARPTFDADGEFIGATVPNDQLEFEGVGTDGVSANGSQMKSDGGCIVIRQKSTESGNASSMNWDNHRTENLTVMSADEYTLTHVSSWNESNGAFTPSDYQEIAIKTNTDKTSSNKGVTAINIKSYVEGKGDTTDYFGIEIIEKDIKIISNSSKAKTENLIEIDESEVKLQSTNSNTGRTTSVTCNPKEVNLKTKDASVTVSKDEVNIYGKSKITLSGDEVMLGGLGNEYVVTASVPFSYRMEDGTVLTATHKVKA